ncbi:MAG: DNA methylase [Oscillospiraceae bacterium]
MEKNKQKVYIAIDLKSFYASVECIQRGLDPMQTNLVVADKSRTEKTICLAVSPSLKAYGIPGRARLFEVVQKVREVNALRKSRAPGRTLVSASSHDPDVKTSPSLALDYLVAPPQMALYMKRSTEIYNVYLNYIAPEDIHVYSIDEVFMDVTNYLDTYRCTARELTMTMIRDVLKTTGITATAGIGTNLYLAKIAMDIEAKHIAPDKDGVRIAEVDELSYRRELWTHRPLTDFWRVGRGYAKKLESIGLYTMGDVARHSLRDEERLYKLFGINAELLIDHAWGWEPCTIAHIKAYKPESNSIGSGQVLQCPYSFEKAKLVVREMTELLVLALVRKELVTDQMVLTVGYDIENLTDPAVRNRYSGEVTTDHYGRSVPKAAHGTANLDRQTSSTMLIVEAVMALCDRIMNPKLLVRRINLVANRVVPESAARQPEAEQLDLFTDYAVQQEKRQREAADLEREKRMQHAMLEIQEKFGRNAILKGSNLQEGATTIQRNGQIGGHKA